MNVRSSFTNYSDPEQAYRAVLEQIRPLAPYMRVIKQPIREVPAQEREHLRNKFDKHRKPAFLGWLCQEKRPELRSFGLEDRHIASLGKSRRLGSPDLPFKLNMCTIDHIVSLGIGGSNNHENLCIIPSWINQLKEKFELRQMALNPAASHRLVLVPARNGDGSIPILPHFPDNFYMPHDHDMKRRMIDKLGWKHAL